MFSLDFSVQILLNFLYANQLCEYNNKNLSKVKFYANFLVESCLCVSLTVWCFCVPRWTTRNINISTQQLLIPSKIYLENKNRIWLSSDRPTEEGLWRVQWGSSIDWTVKTFYSTRQSGTKKWSHFFCGKKKKKPLATLWSLVAMRRWSTAKCQEFSATDASGFPFQSR